ncbi:MAG: AAA family ATPase, partial [Acidobacteriota bacterium]|nr:AAA family ATPase [Acidobacteriota bacterium]
PIVITGFMAAGKTAVAAALARRLSCSMIDLDEFIRKREGRTPQEIIDEEGEGRFREIESEALRRALESGVARIIALGGGAWTIPSNRALVLEHNGFTVWLDAPFELCWRRVEGEADTRPFARNFDGARKLYDRRRLVYEQAEFHVKVVEDKSPEMIAKEIADALPE